MSNNDDIPGAGAAFETDDIPTNEPDSPGGIGQNPLVKGLLETDPPSDPDGAFGYLMSGVKKFINGSLNAGIRHGTTAVEDLITGGYMMFASEDELDEDEEPEPRESFDEVDVE